jgi:TolB-like protein
MISGTVVEPFQDAGARHLKNIAEPQRVFVWNGRLLDGGADDEKSDRGGKSSLVVLPFSTTQADAETASLAIGLSDTIITALSRFSWFLTVPRNISRIYEGRAVPLDDVKRDLGVSYAVEGKLRTAGTRVRVNADLLDTATGACIWSGHVDGNAEDPFEMEDQITRAILAELLPRILGAESRRAGFASDGSAWDLIMQGRKLMWHVSRQDVERAQALFRQASTLDPESGIGQCDLSWSYTLQRIFGWGETLDHTSRMAMDTARLAVAADEGDAYALAAFGFAHLLISEAEDALGQRAIQLNPHLSVAHAGISLGLFQKGRYEEANRFGEDSLQLSPMDPLRSLVRAARGMCFLMMDRNEELEQNARAMIRDFPGMPTGYRQLAVAHVKSGRDAEARRIVEEEILRLMPDHTASASGRQIPFGPNGAARDHWVDMLVRAGLPR